MKPQNLVSRHRLSTSKISLNCPVLDSFLSGGIPSHSITEIVAESGSGKTQLCLQLLLSHSHSSLFLHSEFPFPLRRLLSLSPSTLHPLDRILVEPLLSADHLLDQLLTLQSRISAYNSSHPDSPIKLIVIDSIAALFRSDFDHTPADYKRRSSLFFKVAARLKLLAEMFGLAVVVTNQVGDVIGEGGVAGLRVGNLAALVSSGRQVCPALGLAWANCVNTRLFLSRTEDEVVVGGEGVAATRSRRHIHVVFAPHLPSSCCEFVIRKEGVFGV